MKYYVNQATGLAVVTGTIESISEDRTVMVVKSQTYDRAEKKNKEISLNVTSPIGFEDSFKVGYSVMASGYQRGKGNIIAECASIGNEALETEDLAVVSGLVKFARLNEEKNADGSPKMKADGVTPKKPHFDITISVNDGEKYVDHVIKVYELANVEKSQMETMRKAFKNFDNKTNRIRATFVTQPGQSYSTTVTRDGREYVNHGCSHMGYKSFDLEYIDQRERENGKTEKPKAQDNEASKNVTPSMDTPNNGFSSEPVIEPDDMFR